MSAKHYDAIVLGIGGVGSAAAWRLAKRGAGVLGIDRYAPPHAEGSSHAQTRIIRQAYFEHPAYVPLVRQAYDLWAELESETGALLFQRTGLIEVGPADGVVVPGVLRAAAEHQIPIEQLTPRDMKTRWPQLVAPDELQAVYEPTAGFLYVERCVQACLDAAIECGAELQVDTTVQSWRSEPDHLLVETSAGRFACDRLLITAGAWARELLPEACAPLRILRKSLFWFNAPADHGPESVVPFLFELPAGVFYGFPSIEPWGLKVGDHAAGKQLDRPEAIDRGVNAAEEAAIHEFVAAHLPRVPCHTTRHATCFYTMSPDEHFIVDRLPSDPRIAFVAGLSGHGFKFTPLLGEVLADLALEGATATPIEFLSLRRFTEPSSRQRV